MAHSYTLRRPDVFPTGTTVSAYVKFGALPSPWSGKPSGALVTTGTATSTEVVLDGLEDDTDYWAYAPSPDRYITFRSSPSASSGGGGGDGGGGGSQVVPIIYSRDTAGVGTTGPVQMPGPGSFTQVSLAVTGAPTGSALTLQLRKNTVVLASLTVPAGSVAPLAHAMDDTFEATDLIDVHCTSAGSSTPASGVVLTAWAQVDDIVDPIVVGDTDGGPYMALVQGVASLVSYYGLAEAGGSTAIDHQDNNPGNYAGSPSKVATLVLGGDGALNLNGTTQGVLIPGSGSLQPLSITLEAWIKPDTMPAVSMIMDVGGGGYLSFFFSNPALTGGVTKLVGVFWDGAVNRQVVGATTIVAGTLYHVALTWNDTTDDFKIFINGVQDAVANHAGLAIGWSTPTDSAIGCAASGSSNFFDGVIDEPAIYNAALDAATLLAHYDLGT